MARVRFLDQVPVGFYEVGNTGGGGGGGTPGGSPGSIQYNADNNAFGGSNNLIWDPNTNILTVVGTIIATSFTGSLLGTASYATNAISASTSLTASDISPAIINNNGGQVLLSTGTGKISGSTDFLYDAAAYNFRIVNSNLIIGDLNSNVTIGNFGSGFAQGDSVTVTGTGAHAQGFSTTTNGDYSHAEGTSTLASGDYSHAEGDNTQANGYGAHAEGDNTKANGNYSHAEGYTTVATGSYSHAEGYYTEASGDYSHAEGQGIAVGTYSHAEGNGTANGIGSHAEGTSTLASGDYSHAEGRDTITVSDFQHAQGTCNLPISGAGAFILGNGTDNSNRSNLIFASGSLVQVTGSVIATQGFTGSLFGTSSWATSATKIQSGSITASINPSSGTFNIRSGSTDLLYVSSSNGNVGISGSVAAPAGTITTLTSTTTNVDGLLSFDRMTSLKAYISIPASTSTNIIQYSSLDYFGIVIEGVALNVSTGESLIFRYTLANNQIKIGSPDTVVLSSTDENYALEFYTKVTFKAGIDTISNIVNVIIGNSYSNYLNIRPMYRLVKAAIG
jgi:hypothetical protein